MTPKTILLHIGTPKTGTTSIQRRLAAGEADGSLLPYRYPIWRRSHNHNRLTILYLPHADLPQARLAEYPHNDEHFQRAQRRYRRSLFKALRSAEGAILSGESLSVFFSPSTTAELRSDLESLGFRKFHVVLFVRDPADFYLSHTQHAMKRSFYPRPAVADPVSFNYQFRRMVETWEQVFPGSVIVRRFPSGPQGDVVDDFRGLLREQLGITLPAGSAQLNTTFSAEAMAVLQDYRRATGPDEGGLLIPGLDRLVDFLSQSGQRIDQTRPRLKEAVAAHIRANHRQDADLLRARYGVDLGLSQLDPPAPLPPRSSWRVVDILEAVDREIVERLQEEFARTDPPRRRTLPVRTVARAYRAMPPTLRSARLERVLRTRFTRGPQV